MSALMLSMSEEAVEIRNVVGVAASCNAVVVGGGGGREEEEKEEEGEEEEGEGENAVLEDGRDTTRKQSTTGYKIRKIIVFMVEIFR